MFSQFLILLMTILVNHLNANVLLNEFFPFGLDHNDTDLSTVFSENGSPDGSSPAISLKVPFTFYSKRHDSLWVNMNGLISFDQEYSYAYDSGQTVECRPIHQQTDLIMPFWANHDLAHGGSIYYRQTSDPMVLNKAKSIIASAYLDFNDKTGLSWAFLATWYKVHFHDSFGISNSTNTYQVALISDGHNCFVIFNYNQIEWTTGSDPMNGGDKNGLNGLPARIGLENEYGKQYLLPGSCTPEIINIKDISNVNYPGQFVLKVDGSDVITPKPQPVITTVTKTIEYTDYSMTPHIDNHGDFRKHYDSTQQNLSDLRIRSTNDCSKLVKRPALKRECLQKLQLINELLVEIKMTKSVHELKLIDDEIMEIIVALTEIETDTF